MSDWLQFQREEEMKQSKFKTKATIHSFTDPSKKYTLKQDFDGNITCSCPSWIFKNCEIVDGKRICKHINAVLKHADNLEKMMFFSDNYEVEIDGRKWIVEKKV